jgi:hypothetical protein
MILRIASVPPLALPKSGSRVEGHTFLSACTTSSPLFLQGYYDTDSGKCQGITLEIFRNLISDFLLFKATMSWVADAILEMCFILTQVNFIILIP